jgi:hypothetical protein
VVVRHPQLLARVDALALAVQPLAVEQTGARKLGTERSSAQPINRFAVQLFCGGLLTEQRAAACLDAERPVCAAGLRRVAQPLEGSSRRLAVSGACGCLGLPPIRREPAPQGRIDRIAIGAAGDDRLAVRKVMRLLDRLGFDPVDAGPLRNGVLLEPDGSPIAITFDADQLSKRVADRHLPTNVLH